MTQMPPSGSPSGMPPGMPPAGPMSYQTPPGGQSAQGLAMGSMVCGVISAVLSLFSFCLWFVSLPLGVVAVILALVARGKIASGQPGSGGLAKTGLITGIIGIVLSLLLPVVLYSGLKTAGNKLQQEAERMQRDAERRQQQQHQTPPATNP